MDVTVGHSEVKTGFKSSDFLRLEAEVDQVLQDFRKSQQLEYKVVEGTLQKQKAHLLNLYQQLESDQSTPASSKVSSRAIKEIKKQIRRELEKFKKMKKVADGFGKTPNCIIKNHFQL